MSESCTKVCAQSQRYECETNLPESPSRTSSDFQAIAIKVFGNDCFTARSSPEAYLRVKMEEITVNFFNSSLERTCFCTDFRPPDKRSSRWGLILRFDWPIINHVANSNTLRKCNIPCISLLPRSRENRGALWLVEQVVEGKLLWNPQFLRKISRFRAKFIQR